MMAALGIVSLIGLVGLGLFMIFLSGSYGDVDGEGVGTGMILIILGIVSCCILVYADDSFKLILNLFLKYLQNIMLFGFNRIMVDSS